MDKPMKIHPGWGKKENPPVVKKIFNAFILDESTCTLKSGIKKYNYRGVTILYPELYWEDEQGNRLIEYDTTNINDINLIALCKEIDKQLDNHE